MSVTVVILQRSRTARAVITMQYAVKEQPRLSHPRPEQVTINPNTHRTSTTPTRAVSAKTSSQLATRSP